MKSKLGMASVLFLLTTLLLKISGLIRDMIIAFYFGDSYQADAFLAAFIIPNMLFLFMTNGMKNALVPSYLEAASKGRADSHLTQVLKGTAVVSAVLAAIGAGLSPYIIPLLYPGFSEQAQMIAVWVSVLLMSALVFVGINAVLEAYLDANNRFSIATVSQILVIAGMILSAILFAEQIGPYALAAGYLIGAAVSLLFKLIFVVPKQTINLREKINFKEVNAFYAIFIPVAVTVMVGQINLAVDNIFAGQFSEGTVTYINYAKNLVHFPQAIFGVTIATIVFPILAKAEASDDRLLFKRTIAQGLTTMYLIVLPAVTGMMVLMPSIIGLLYERGAFTHQATLATSQAAYYYFGSVLFFSLNTMINKGFYSLKKGKLIMGLGAASILFNVIFNYIFTRWLGYTGIPLASSVIGFLYIAIGFWIFLRLAGGLPLQMLGREFVKITIAALAMLAGILPLISLLAEWPLAVSVIAIAGAGAIIYSVSAYLLRIEAMLFLWKNLRRKNNQKETTGR
ncbi:murein biosynthesis integral membrane protein MurJ [Sediminibacillus albus]|uniref:murein biosynthesis integral membrane protein MurJ n=1 Tax=Sediminibacillus albus TaxID=407036 RepID=UPI000B8857E3|nr:murein biosynthesis integral membrane protein MurJ [Sediminibacillus albus]